MKILIDIGHPAHVHLFKYFARDMQKKGHEIFFTCREKEFEIYLLKKYGFNYISFGKKYRSKIGKLLGLIKFDVKEFFAGLKFRPDLFLSHGSMYAAHAAFLLKKPHISLEDSENMEQIRLYKTFTNLILSPEAVIKDLGKNHLKYRGFHQNAYLMPEFFAPDDKVYELLGIEKKQPYYLLRFVALSATHDAGLQTTDWRQRKEMIDLLERYGKVFISSESEIPHGFRKYKLPDIPEYMLDLIYFADLLIGESGAMTNEAAFLGTPNMLIVNLKLGVHEEYKRLGLKLHFKQYDEGVLYKIKNILENIHAVKFSFRSASQNYIEKSIDLVRFLEWIAEEMPDSLNTDFIRTSQWGKYVK